MDGARSSHLCTIASKVPSEAKRESQIKQFSRQLSVLKQLLEMVTGVLATRTDTSVPVTDKSRWLLRLDGGYCTTEIINYLLGEQRLARAMRAIKSMTPVFVFMDEVGRIGQCSESGDSGVSGRVFKQLLENYPSRAGILVWRYQ